MDPSDEVTFEDRMIEIERLLKECQTMAFKSEPEKPKAFIPTPVQIRKFMTFTFLFQLYTLLIDPEFILVRGIDKFLSDLNEELLSQQTLKQIDEKLELEIDDVD